MAGLLLVAAEIFLTPGFGLPGIAGAICCVVGLLAILVANPPNKLPIPQTPLGWDMFLNGVMAMLVGFILACVAAAMIARYLPKTAVGGKLVLHAPDAAEFSPSGEKAAIKSVSAGTIGIVEGQCRPVGLVRFGETLVDAIADGNFIPVGARVTVLKVEGNRVLVAAVRDDAGSTRNFT